MSRSAHDVLDAEHEPVAQFEVIFPRSFHVTSMRTLPTKFLIDDDHIPMKLDKLLGI